MAFPTDPLDPQNSDIDKVRLNVGDTDSSDVEYPEEIYQYTLDNNAGDIGLATIDMLKLLVAKYAGACEEEVGDVLVKFQQAFQGYVDLLDKFLKDPSYSLLGVITPYAGGLSFSEREADACNTDLRDNQFSAGSAIRRSRVSYRAGFEKA
jgi:hypothetical protein